MLQFPLLGTGTSRVKLSQVVPGGVTKLSDFSPVADGVTDCSGAFLAASNAALASNSNLWEGYHLVEIDQPGKYFLANPRIIQKQGLAFVGHGLDTVMVQHPTIAWVSFEDCQRIGLFDIAWDANGIGAFGGIRMVSVKDLWFSGNHIFDSKAPGLFGNNDADRFSIGSTMNTEHNFDWVVEDNIVEDLQLAFSPLHRFLVRRNLSIRSPSTAAIGFWTNGDGWGITDGLVTENHIIDPKSNAFCLNKDVPGAQFACFERVTFADNLIEAFNMAPMAFQLGTASVFGQQRTDVFRQIKILGNHIIYHPSCRQQVQEQAIIRGMVAYDVDSFFFDEMDISGNVIECNGRATWGIEMRRTINSTFRSNFLFDIQGPGLNIIGKETGPSNNIIEDNFVGTFDTGSPYWLGNSHGNLKFRNNRYSGNVATPLNYYVDGSSQSTVDGPDNVIEQPTQVS